MPSRTRLPRTRRLAELEQRTLAAQRVLLTALVALAPLVFWRATQDIFGIVKATLVLVATVALLAVGGVRVARTGRVVVPSHPAVLAVGAFLLVALAATLWSDATVLSFTGHYARFTGLVLYAAYAAVFVVTLRAFDAGTASVLAFGVLAGSLGIAVYAHVQWAGLDPIPWTGSWIATASVGNPNYVAAHLGIGFPLALWLAADPSRSREVRIGAAIGAAALALGLFPASSDQGWVAAAAGAGVVAMGWSLGRSEPIRTWVPRLVPAGGAGVVAALVLGLGGRGPLSYLADKFSTRARTNDWRAAWNMITDRPLTGVGFDRFGAYYHAYRDAEATLVHSLDRTTSTPHSVHLNMFVSGGLVLGLAYLAVAAVVAWALVSGLRRLEGRERLLLAGVGGAWVAYQTQAFVSIDVPSLAVTGWALAALVVTIGSPPELRERWLPWARPADPSAKRSKQAARQAARADRIGRPVAYGIVAVATLLVWPLTVPVRADVESKRANRLLDAGQHELALAHATSAHGMVSWETGYAMLVGRVLVGAERMEEALTAFEDAAARDPRAIGPAVTCARVAERIGDFDRAHAWYLVALELEPNDATLKAEAARFLMRIEEFEVARGLLEDAVRVDDGDARWWVHLGYARENTGDVPGARDAYERALALDPDNGEARSRLDRLGDA